MLREILSIRLGAIDREISSTRYIIIVIAVFCLTIKLFSYISIITFSIFAIKHYELNNLFIL